MHIAIPTFDGFNKLDSLIALGILNRVKMPGWRVMLVCPTATLTSMNGVVMRASPYLAAWVIARLQGLDTARSALHDAAPVGEEAAYVDRARAHLMPCLPVQADALG